MIIIVSSVDDLHAQVVIEQLRLRGGEFYLLDLSSFPQQAQLSLNFIGDPERQYHTLTAQNQVLELSDSTVIWWRRPQPFIIHPEIDGGEDRNFAYTECDAAFSGLWLALDAFWINHPTLDEEAARKVYQLNVAEEVGFRIPTTCITNSAEQARQFVEQRGVDNTIYKAFSGTERAWRETRILKSDEVELIENVRYAPVIFQEYIPAATDLRVTVIGERVFAAAIYSQDTSYKVDFRMTMDEADVRAYDLPGPVVEMLQKYMKRLGLVYGAIDMRLTPEGEYVFLEINPSGQWLFIEQRTGQPITEALVELMLQHIS
jgi:glutathione synthase/RimK-type ligase-like ATP-grasp enzyme